MKTNATTLKGVFCPTITPFDEQLNPDKKRFIQQCHRVLEEGCHGLAVFGTTGEANSLSVEERMMLLDALVESGIDGSVIMPGTGCTALTDSVRLSRHAVQLGCSGVLMLPPFYYKNIRNTNRASLLWKYRRIFFEVKKTSLVLLVGGKGTRIKSITKNIPKPLIKIKKFIFLDYLITNLCKFNLDKI